MPNSHDSNNISRESENVKLAKTIIAGQDANFDIMFGLAKKLKNERAFGYARSQSSRQPLETRAATRVGHV